MTHRRWGAEALGLWCLVVLAASGCSAPQRPSAPARDSAGVTIIASTAPVWAEGHGWIVADSPTVDLRGVMDPRGAVRLSDGRIIVAEGRPVQLRYFTPEGRPLYEAGGPSDGPAAIRYISHLALGRGDTAVVYDAMERKLLLFDPNGGLAVTVKVGPGLIPQGSNGFLAKGVAPDGRALFQRDEVAFPFAGTEGAVITDSTRLFWLSRQGTFADSSSRLVAGELFGLSIPGGRGERFMAPLARPLAPVLQVAAGAEVVWIGDGSSWEVRGLDGRGNVVRIIRLARTRTVLTQALRDSFIIGYRKGVAAMSELAIQRQFAAGLATAPFPPQLPAYQGLLAGADTTLWVQHAGLFDGTVGDAGLMRSVFDPAGRWLGDVMLPPRFQPTAVGRGWILGLWYDDSGAPRVRLYPIVER